LGICGSVLTGILGLGSGDHLFGIGLPCMFRRGWYSLLVWVGIYNKTTRHDVHKVSYPSETCVTLT
jgi:hypothetical protein